MTGRRSIGSMSPKISVADSPDANRYEITVDGERVGFVSYRLAPDEIAFLHAEINPALEGHGLGSQLVADALDDARSRGLTVRPLCPFVVDYIGGHPEYADLVADDDRRRLGI
jgi:predicted GNAT family acetyltransferase